jgi:hypothetical protein
MAIHLGILIAISPAYIRYRKVGPAPKHCCDCPCSSGITLSSPCWYSEVLLLLWCSNIIATISSADCCVQLSRPGSRQQGSGSCINARKFRHHGRCRCLWRLCISDTNHHNAPGSYPIRSVLSCTKMTFIDQRCVADEHDRQLVIDHVYVIDETAAQ